MISNGNSAMILAAVQSTMWVSLATGAFVGACFGAMIAGAVVFVSISG
jgi:hypothetical protein